MRYIFSSLSVILSLSWAAPTAYAEEQLTNDTSINAIIAAMTIEEKASIIAGTGMNNAQNVVGAAGSTFAVPRFGIPQTVMADGPIGVRLGAGPTGGEKRFSTGFPISSSLAATWNDTLIYSIAETMGNEAKAFGVDLLLGPAINIQRNTLGGRNFEYYSEDPLLTGRISAAFVNGLQSTGVGATVKHFAANNQETRRQSINQIISERALREIYLRAFEFTLETSKPWAIMSSYPSINGQFASQNAQLLTQILRNEWGYTGLVMSDWYGVKDPVKALIAGNDLIMPGGARKTESSFSGENKAPEDTVLQALLSGELTQDSIDINIKRILQMVLKSGVFKGNIPTTPALDRHAQVTYKAAIDGMVLLKNDEKALPIPLTKTVAILGKNAQQFYIGGGGSAEVNVEPQRIKLPLPALKTAGYQLITDINDKPLNEQSDETQIAQASKLADVAMIFIGKTSTEGADRFSMALHDDEILLIRNTIKYFHALNKKVVVLLNIGSPIEMSDWNNDVDAILLTWQPGQEGGNALADIISGKVSPSGKLPFTFPKYYKDTPSYGNYPGDNNTVIYGEGIYVGYRYYDTRGIEPLYPFGHGLTYTQFEYKNLSVNPDVINLDNNENAIVSVTIKNIGDTEAQEIVQLYINDLHSKIDRPFQELKNYHKISLQPQEEKTIKFAIDQRALSYYDTSKKAWTVEPGKFSVRIGSSSRDIRLDKTFVVQSAKYPAIELSTPWIDIQTYQAAATIIARYIGEDETNGWISGEPSLLDKMNSYFDNSSELKDNAEKRQEILQDVLSKLNQL